MDLLHKFYIVPVPYPQCTILWQKCAHVATFLFRNGSLWEMCLMHCAIREMGQLIDKSLSRSRLHWAIWFAGAIVYTCVVSLISYNALDDQINVFSSQILLYFLIDSLNINKQTQWQHKSMCMQVRYKRVNNIQWTSLQILLVAVI